MSLLQEPVVSWLTMERYVLGELSEVERREVELTLLSNPPVGTDNEGCVVERLA